MGLLLLSVVVAAYSCPTVGRGSDAVINLGHHGQRRLRSHLGRRALLRSYHRRERRTLLSIDDIPLRTVHRLAVIHVARRRRRHIARLAQRGQLPDVRVLVRTVMMMMAMMHDVQSHHSVWILDMHSENRNV